MLTAGSIAPAFSALDQHGIMRSLGDYKGSWVLLYFYPKDHTPGCTAQACEFRDTMNAFREKNLVILGVSADSQESHKKFGDTYAISFSLLADTDKTIIKTYQVWGEKSSRGKVYEGIIRTSVLINPDGIIHKVYERVQPEGHAENVLNDMKAIQ